MTDNPLPEYINEAGWQLYQPPFLFSNCSIYSFFLLGDRQKMQTFCDHYLNDRIPSEAGIEYEVISKHVLVSIIDIPHLTSIQPAHGNNPDVGKGWLKERDFAFWILALRKKRVDGIWLPDQLVFLPPFLFVNNPLTMVGGREIYGFPKDYGEIEIPDPIESGPITLDTLFAETFTPDCEWKHERLATIIRNETHEPTKQSLWEKCEHAAGELVRRFFPFEFDGKLKIPGLGEAFHVAEFFDLEKATIVFLKQMRDIRLTSHACYQCVTEADFEVTKFREAGLLLGEYSLQLTRNASYDFNHYLGLQWGTQPVLFATYAKLDFSIGGGSHMY